MKYLLRALLACQVLLFPGIAVVAQSLQPFTNCPGVSVAITRPGLDTSTASFRIYLIDSAGGIKPSGHPINLQINGFGLNTADGFLYGIHETPNVADPFLTRVDTNGNFENLGMLLAPKAGPFKVGVVNTAAGTNDDNDNFYFLAAVVNLQNISELPELFLGKVENVSDLPKSNLALDIKYTMINPGTCLPELLAALQAPLSGILQDIAFNPFDGHIYTFMPGPGRTPAPGKIAWFNPVDSPTFNCINPAQPNIPTRDMAGLFFGKDSALYMLTIDGKYYKGNPHTGAISLVAQTALPLLDSNLRGDMASCIGKKPMKKVLVPFENCPDVSVAVTRPGFNSTDSPYQIFLIDEFGTVQASGKPIHLQINAFGLNNKDGFLYGLHETADLTKPFFTRVDKFGNFENISRLTPPPLDASHNLSIINTVAATMDGSDNYYFTAVMADTPLNPSNIPKLFLGTITKVSSLKAGDSIHITYKEIKIGSCEDIIERVLANPKVGLLQDISFDPVNHNIYTTIPTKDTSPAPEVIAHFNPWSQHPVLKCIKPEHPNIPIEDMCGLFSDDQGGLFILTIDGKFYKGNVHNGVIRFIAQTTLPLLKNNLRGDMASCVRKIAHRGRHEGEEDDEDDDEDEDHDNGDHDNGDHDHGDRDHGDHDSDHIEGGLRIAPNPVQTDQIIIFVNSGERERANLQIMGPSGNRVQARDLILDRGANQIRIDVSQLNQGIYSVIIFFPSGHVNVARFIRIRD